MSYAEQVNLQIKIWQALYLVLEENIRKRMYQAFSIQYNKFISQAEDMSVLADILKCENRKNIKQALRRGISKESLLQNIEKEINPYGDVGENILEQTKKMFI